MPIVAFGRKVNPDTHPICGYKDQDTLYRLSETVGFILKHDFVDMIGGISLCSNLIHIAADGMKFPYHGKIIKRGQFLGYITVDRGTNECLL